MPIEVDLENIQLLKIDENEHTITLKLNMIFSWEEPRLITSPNATIENFDLMDKWDKDMELPEEFTKKLWLPDAYIENVHKISKFNLIRNYESIEYHYQDWKKGKDENKHGLTYRNEFEIVMFCNMIFKSYPLDQQTCYFRLGSSLPLITSEQGYRLTNLQFNTSEQKALQDYFYEIKEYMKYEVDTGIQRIGFELKFQHNLVPFLMNYYIPSGILVILSWVGNHCVASFKIISIMLRNHILLT